MININNTNTSVKFSPFNRMQGFTLPEVLVAASAGVVLIGASALALRSTGSLISKMDRKASLQQNTISGKKLMRAEIERSLHLIVHSSAKPEKKLSHTDIFNPDYLISTKECNDITESSNTLFKPIFGLKIAELNKPVFYGLSISNTGRGYSIMRCGARMNLDGRYNETEKQNISVVIDDIGVIRCNSDQPECSINAKYTPTSLKQISETIKFTFKQDKTPERNYGEPAIRLMTDEHRKLIRFIDPTNNSDDIKTSFLKIEAINKEITTYPFYFVAYARADKRINSEKKAGNVMDGLYFQNITNNKIRFLVDGSGSMSACILWGSGYGAKKWYWDPWKEKHFWSKRTCALTRMESLQHELISLLTDLPDDTAISIRSFSSPGKKNHQIWEMSAKGLVELGSNGARKSAIAFVNTFDDGHVFSWGSTQPWGGLEEAFNDLETETLYFLSDGKPNHNRIGGIWKSSDHSSSANYYLNLNYKRSKPLKVNTIAIGIKSSWMESLATNTGGDYIYIDKKYLKDSAKLQ
ncbi:hypothetical protein [Synechococcus sp. MU1625]|uniref:hypothetical protein n=1 Tax=Synechococcus sp. MU1625 TaxID=2508347 RepID=UPI001CF8B2C1|nr:hypothetical protein [Synechococcus sp. MU1625]MCB4398426.1 hypothetical protein [Synechococcus sp. MU1625]